MTSKEKTTAKPVPKKTTTHAVTPAVKSTTQKPPSKSSLTTSSKSSTTIKTSTIPPKSTIKSVPAKPGTTSVASTKVKPKVTTKHASRKVHDPKSGSVKNINWQSKYDPQTVLFIRDVFQKFDADGDGKVSRLEFRKADKSVFGELYSNTLFDALDKDKRDEITFAQLLELFFPFATKKEKEQMIQLCFPPKPKEQEIVLTPEEIEEIKTIFTLYDKDGSGTLTKEEWIAATQNIMSSEEIEESFAAIDVDKSNSVTLEEFINDMKRVYAASKKPNQQQARVDVHI